MFVMCDIILWFWQHFFTYLRRRYSKITLTIFQEEIKMAAAQVFIKSKINPAVKGAMDKVVKWMVLNTELIWAKRSSSFLDTTMIQSFSIIIFDPTEAKWAMSAKMIVIIGTAVGTQEGQDSSPTYKKYWIFK